MANLSGVNATNLDTLEELQKQLDTQFEDIVKEKADQVLQEAEKIAVEKAKEVKRPEDLKKLTSNLTHIEKGKSVFFLGSLLAGITALLPLATKLLSNEKLDMILDLASSLAGSIGNEELVEKVTKFKEAKGILLSSQKVSLAETLEKAARTNVKSPGEALMLTGLSTITWFGAKTGIAPKGLQLLKIFKPELYETTVKLLKRIYGEKYAHLLEAWGIEVETSKFNFIKRFLYETKAGKAILEFAKKFSVLVDKLKPVFKFLAKVWNAFRQFFNFVAKKLRDFFDTVTDALRRFKESIFEYNPLKLLQLVNPVAFAPFLEPLYEWVYEKFKGLLKTTTENFFAFVKWAILKPLEQRQKQEKSVVQKAQKEVANFFTWAIRFLRPDWKGRMWRRLIRTVAWLGSTKFGQYFLLPLLRALNIPGLSLVFTILERYPLLAKIASVLAKYIDTLLKPIRQAIRTLASILMKVLRKLGMRSEMKYVRDIFHTVDYTLDKVLKTFISASARIDKIQETAEKIEKAWKTIGWFYKTLVIGGKILFRLSPLLFAGAGGYFIYKYLFGSLQGTQLASKEQAEPTEPTEETLEPKQVSEGIVTAFIDNVVQFTKNLVDKITQFFTSEEKTKEQEVLQNLHKKEVAEKLKETVHNEIKKEAETLPGLTLLKNLWHGLVNLVKGLWNLLETIANKVKDVASWILSIFGDEKTKNALNQAKEKQKEPLVQGTLQVESYMSTQTFTNVPAVQSAHTFGLTIRQTITGGTKSATLHGQLSQGQPVQKSEETESTSMTYIPAPNAPVKVAVGPTYKTDDSYEIYLQALQSSTRNLLKTNPVYWLDEELWH